MTQEICRACLQPSIDSVHMSYTYKDELLIDIYARCTEVILKDDAVLCRICEKRLLDSYEFRCQAQESEGVWQKFGVAVKNEKNLDTEVVVQEEYLEDATYEEDSPLFTKENDPVEIKLEIEDGEIEAERNKKRPKASSSNRGSICRFCLNFIKGRLFDHEQIHISKKIICQSPYT